MASEAKTRFGCAERAARRIIKLVGQRWTVSQSEIKALQGRVEADAAFVQSSSFLKNVSLTDHAHAKRPTQRLGDCRCAIAHRICAFIFRARNLITVSNGTKCQVLMIPQSVGVCWLCGSTGHRCISLGCELGTVALTASLCSNIFTGRGTPLGWPPSCILQTVLGCQGHTATAGSLRPGENGTAEPGKVAEEDHQKKSSPITGLYSGHWKRSLG